MVRDGQRVPLTFIDWTAVDESIKEGIWIEVKRNVLNVPEDFKVVCLKMCNNAWRDHKRKIKDKYFKPNKDDPELSSKCPPNIVPEQWPILVAYWRSDEAKEVSRRNSSNREMKGPYHVTGRNSFAEIRYKMAQSGEPIDKMSVWIKSRNTADRDVVEAIKDYNNLLNMEPKDRRQLTIVKDQIFHQIFGQDGHGYRRTYGSSAPRCVVNPSNSSTLNGTADLIQKITEEVTEKVTKEVTEKVTKEVTEKVTKEVTEKVTKDVTEKVTKEVVERGDEDRRQLALNFEQFAAKYELLNARLLSLESNDGISANSQVQAATSVHQRESIGDGAHILTSEEEAIVTKEGAGNVLS